MTPSQDSTKGAPPRPRKSYRRPVLTVYGDLRQITQTSSASGSTNDKSTGKNKSR
jgi:hypothetical protein